MALALAAAALLPYGAARAQGAVPDALAAVARQPRAFHGSVGSRSLHVGLELPRPDGRFAGTAVLLDAASHVVASGPVRGRVTRHACRLRLDLGDVTARIVGACRADTLSGTLDEVRQRPFSLVRFLAAKGDEHVIGEVWLTPGP